MTRVGRQRLGAVLLLLSGCEPERQRPTSGAPESDTPSSVMDDPACSDAQCAALAGVCQQARCDARTGECRIAAARDGEPCLEGNPCGASECRSGECRPLAPPTCDELSDACRRGVCRPEAGCVAEPRVVPGANEANAVRLPSRGAGNVTASSACPDQPSVPLSCTEGLTGPSSIFELDLREATGLTRAHLIVDARFEFEAALTRGPSADPAVVHCAEPFYTDGKSRQLSVELAPGRYHLVVTGKSESDRGSISVASSLGPDTAAPTNDDWGTPFVLDGAIEQQSIIPSMLGATPQVSVRCAALDDVDVFYALDLSGRSSEVLLDVDALGLDDAYPRASLLAVGSDARTEVLACGEYWSRRVSPGIYALAVHVSPQRTDQRLGLRVRVTEESCSSAVNDRVETAVELDPTLATQRIQGNTACGNDDVSEACSSDRGAPDLFYRLDLRNHTAPQYLRFDGEYATDLLNYVLVSSDDTDVLLPTRCGAAIGDLTLAPRLYYLVLDGLAQNAGRFELALRLGNAYSDPPNCRRDRDTFRYCLSDSEPACAISLAHPGCIGAAVECGLGSDALATFCTAHPGCCDGTAPTESCEGPWDEAAIVCAP